MVSRYFGSGSIDESDTLKPATSPPRIIFGRTLRDGLTFVNKLEKFCNPPCPSPMAPCLGNQRGGAANTHGPDHRISQGPLQATTSPIYRREGVPTESTGQPPNQVGQIRHSSGVYRLRSVQGKGRWFWTPDPAQSPFHAGVDASHSILPSGVHSGTLSHPRR